MTKSNMTWEPLLEGHLADRAVHAVGEIADILRDTAPGLSDPRFATGLAGVALFHGYHAAALGEESAAALAEERLAQAGDSLAETDLPASLFTGYTGVAWANQHLDQLLTGEATPGLNEEVDEALAETVQMTPWPWSYDLMFGLAGAGFYAVDHPDRSYGERILREIVDRLDETALEDAGGLAWRTPASQMSQYNAARFPAGHVDTGVAHGVPGVIGVLARACAADLAGGKARHLLDGAVKWLLANRRPEDGGSVFGRYIGGDGVPTCRSAWCYGDPGVSAVLLSAARAAGEPDWEREALAIALRDCARPLQDMEVMDATLCHGAAGLGHLYNRMYQATAEEVFGRAARKWFETALIMREPGDGYKSWLPREGDAAESARLLEGVTGIGLALIAAVSPLEPGWDRPMLIDLRPERRRLG